jgi:hypothetical protein
MWGRYLPAHEIAKVLHCHERTCRNHAKRLGLPKRDHRVGRKPTTKTMTVCCTSCGETATREYRTAHPKLCPKCYDARNRYVPHPRPKYWTPERKAKAAEIWTAGGTRSTVAAHFGVTVNAAMGILHRMGLLGQRRVHLDAETIRKRRLAKQRERRIRLPRAPKLRGPGRHPSIAVPAPPPLNLSLIENTGCMWPTEKGFCGHPKAGHKHRPHYCEAHCRA